MILNAGLLLTVKFSTLALPTSVGAFSFGFSYSSLQLDLLSS